MLYPLLFQPFRLWIGKRGGFVGVEGAGKFLEKVYNAEDGESLKEAYDLWAEDYDEHVQSFGYRIPGTLMGLFCRHTQAGAGPVLDAGAGTGILGESLAALGYDQVVALDLSQGMLAKAREKGVYESFVQAALGEELDLPDNHFAAVISGGTFTEGHAPPESFDELIRITRPGGRLVFSVLSKVYEGGGFKERQAELEDQGGWRLLEMTPEFKSLPQESETITNRVFAYEVLQAV